MDVPFQQTFRLVITKLNCTCEHKGNHSNGRIAAYSAVSKGLETGYCQAALSTLSEGNFTFLTRATNIFLTTQTRNDQSIMYLAM